MDIPIRTAPPHFVRKRRKNQEVNPGTKEKPWSRVLILITSKLILLNFVLAVEEIFKMDQ